MGRIRNALLGPSVPPEVQAAFSGVPAFMASPAADPSRLPIATPWGESELERWVFADILGADTLPASRAKAMRLPAIARGRNLLASTIARMPLTDPDGDPPAWLYTTGDGSSAQLRMTWTVDDLIFHGWSLWWRENGADGKPLRASRVNYDEWEVDPDGVLLVNGGTVSASDVIVIPGFHEGILNFGGDVLRDADQLYAVVRQRLNNPSPSLDLHQTGGEPLTDAQIDTLTDRWNAARMTAKGGVAYTSEGIEARELGAGGEQLLIEARNAASLDMARLVGVSANRIDATSAKASLNYETTTGRNQEFVDFDLALYMTPITARLSLDDVTPHGRRVAFDLADFIATTPGVTGPLLQD